MSTEANKGIVRRYMQQVWNEGRRDLLEEFFGENPVHHGIPGAPGLEGLKAGYDDSLNAFPDIQLTIDDEIAEDDRVAIRWTLKATHQGDLMGIPATGKEVTQSGTTIYRLADAKIVELWFLADNVSLMQQLGVMPAPGQGGG
jgi:steroid delta-isomerase-like uncharacterized protein